MKKYAPLRSIKWLMLFGFTFSFGFLQAQYFEVGGQLGVAGFRGDVGGHSIDMTQLKPAIGIMGRYNMTPHFSVRAGLSRAEIGATDESATRRVDRERNLSFRSNIVEFHLVGEVNLSKLNIPEKKSSAPYVFAGISAFHFNPQADYRGVWRDLQGLGTEGQLLPDGSGAYNRVQVAIPIGGGFRFALNEKINLGFEIGIRKTMTDYLDDVSGDYVDLDALTAQNPIAAALAFRTPEVVPDVAVPTGMERGDAATKDLFFFTGINVTVNLTDKYGLDFDEKYDIFKTPSEDAEYRAAEKIARQNKKAARKAEKEKVKRLKKMEPIRDGRDKLDQPATKNSLPPAKRDRNKPPSGE